MTQDIAMMKYGQSELPRLSQKGKKRPWGQGHLRNLAVGCQRLDGSNKE